MIALNFSNMEQTVDARSVAAKGQVVISTTLDREEAVDLSALTLRPNEGVIVAL